MENTFTRTADREESVQRGPDTFSVSTPWVPQSASHPEAASTDCIWGSPASGVWSLWAGGYVGEQSEIGGLITEFRHAELLGVNELLRRVPGSNSRASRRSPSSGPLPSPRPPVLRRVLASHGGRLHSVLTVLSWFSVTLPAHLCVASPLNHPQFTHWSVAPVPSEDCR